MLKAQFLGPPVKLCRAAAGMATDQCLVGAASLQQQYPAIRVLGEAERQEPAGGAAADDDVVEALGITLHRTGPQQQAPRT